MMNSQDPFQQLYHDLGRDNVSYERLAQCYSKEIEFTDPFHHVQGLDALTHYFTQMYTNVRAIDFEFIHSLSQGELNIQRWTMSFRHPAIAAGKEVTVEGCSELVWRDGKIIRHTDFFDAGSMLYEHLPVFGWAIRKLKERM